MKSTTPEEEILWETRKVVAAIGYWPYWVWRHYCDFDMGDPFDRLCLCGKEDRKIYQGVKWDDIQMTPCTRCGAAEYEICEGLDEYGETVPCKIHGQRLLAAWRAGKEQRDHVQ